MTDREAQLSMRRVYQLTGLVGLVGFVSYFWVGGPRPALGFALGAASSFGNLWLFDWLSRSIAPGATTTKPWQAGAYVTRYIILLGIGYAIVKALGVSPLAVVLGLLASTAAVLTSSISEIISHFFRRRITH